MKRAVIPGMFMTLLMLMIMLITSACSSSIDDSTPTIPPNKGGAPTIALDNTAPANIDMALSVKIHRPLAPDKTRFEIAAAFYYQQVQIIKFTHGEKFTCNGNVLPVDSSGGYNTYTIPAAGTILTCVYVSPEGQASFSVTIPEQVTLSSPTNGATVTRSTQTPLTIGVAPACNDMTVLLGYKNSQGEFEGGTTEAPDGCSAHQSLNTLTQPAGPGELGVEEMEKVGSITNNAGFHSLTFLITTEMDIAVTWK